ncbi:MAG TPA: hypothetical protein VEZ90_05360 [Blastocatellia bacterium]|nr:hypothetical protein [Blastocatellia bacterium]
MNSSTVAIVQPCELASVAEQRDVLRQYASQQGVSIDLFVGDDCFLRTGSEALDKILESVRTGVTRRIWLLKGIKERLPQGFCDRAIALGGEVSLIEYRKSVLQTG